MNNKEFTQKLISWVFSHSKEAYTKTFWVEHFNLTNDDLVKFEIMNDLSENQKENNYANETGF